MSLSQLATYAVEQALRPAFTIICMARSHALTLSATFLLAIFAAPQLLFAQTTSDAISATTTASASNKTVQVNAGQRVDSGIDVLPGAKIEFTASGTIHDSHGRELTPAGATRGWADLVRSMSVNESGLGALIGRIGNNDAAVPFLIGVSKQIEPNYGGRLYLSINDVIKGQLQIQDTASAYTVEIHLTSAGTKMANTINPGLRHDAERLLDGMPRRIADASGGAGDMVNFLIVGETQTMLDAMQAAGWVIVDRDKKDATVHALISTLEKKDYTEMPMSELYLFGRQQDYGFARAEPLQVVTTRNHLRIWKTDHTLDGKTVWIGAATHDIGLERDQRNNGVTHKIDPDIDKEREYLSSSLIDAGTVAGSAHLSPKDPVREAKTATGGGFHSDGTILLLILK